MADGLEVDVNRFSSLMEQLGSLTKREIEVEFRIQLKGVIVEAYNITPPAQGRGRGVKVGEMDAEAKMRGDRAIDRDLRGIFSPVTLKGERTLRHLFGDTDPPVAHKPPYTFPVKERHPDVQKIYEQRNSRRRGKRLTRGQRAAYYVDRGKLETLARELKENVGTAAAGWNEAAEKLKARVPKYARGKHSLGSCEIQTTATRMRIVFTNEVSFIDKLPEVKRLLQRAINAQADKIERQLPVLLAKAAKDFGFKS